jgi:hypothetical protein
MARQDIAKCLFGALCDKIVGYKYPHAIGLITFGKNIVNLLPISRNFEAFEVSKRKRTMTND